MDRVESSSRSESQINFNEAVDLPSGVQILNCTPHTIVFRHGEIDMRVEPSGAKLTSTAGEQVVGKREEADIVQTVFQPSEQGLKELEAIERYNPNLLVIGSIISAQAYAGRVYAMTPAPGYERVPVEQKRMNPYKFTLYPSINSTEKRPQVLKT